MTRTRSAATVAALAVTAALVTAGPALAWPTGSGPSTTVAGTYRLADDHGAGPWQYAAPADDLTFTLPAGVRVEVVDDGWCVQPDTREVHGSDRDHHGVCTSPAPDGVPASWARPAVAR